MIFWMIFFVIFGGVSVDSANGWRHRAILQATADAAVLAAAIELPDQTDAAASAQALAEANMAAIDHGDVLSPGDVEFGAWDAATGAFTVGGAPNDSVRVTVRRSAANSNPVPTYLLRLSGLFSWNVGAQAVAQRYYPECLNDGLFARGMVDIRSNNLFTNRICVHGQHHVEVNNNNFWSPTVSVSMPSLGDFVIPDGGWASNTNIKQVLREEWFDPKLVDKIDAMITGLTDPNSEWKPAFLGDSPPVKYTTLKDFKPAALTAGSINVVNCNGVNKTINMGNGVIVSNVVIVANCKFLLGNNAKYSNVVIATTAGSPDDAKENIISIGQGTVVGADDECVYGGGVILLSTASVIGAADSSYHGVQIVAKGDISLAAGQGAIEGLQAQTGGDISITSNNAFGTCSGGVDSFRTAYYRLVH